ncbi:MAG: DnaB-like helicase C-terminal domain-containing protein [Lachnospiraceae bacterium]|nr:DnaB-like helicase C-terminal domain-containing protein [Lachnospiraceae bacterium]
MEEEKNVVGFKSTREVVSEVLDEYKLMVERRSEHKGIVTGLSTGFYDIDCKTKGLQNGELILLVGRKLMGKTGLALSIVRNVVTRERVTAAIFSPSITNSRIIKRFLAIEMWDKKEIVLNGPKDSVELDLLNENAQKLVDMPVYIDDSAFITIEDIREKCRELSLEGRLGLIVVDSLQFLSCERDESGLGMKEVVRELKEIAVDEDCPLLLISELLSDGEKDWFKRPELASIDDSDYTKQYADLIMLLYAEQFDREKSPENREADVIIVKNRNGRTGKVKLTMEYDGFWFRNLVRD